MTFPVGCPVPLLNRARLTLARRVTALTVVLTCGAACGSAARADVVILSNRSPNLVKFSAASGAGAGRAYQVAAGDLLPIACREGDRVRIAFLSAGARRDYTLQPNSIYYFHRPANGEKLDLEQIAISHEAHQKSNPAPRKEHPGDAKRTATEPPPLAKVKVKILVDDDENAVRELWETRLRKRIAEAAKILEKYAGATLEIVACDTWKTPNDVHNFDELLRHFEGDVPADSADLVIGFSSQYTAFSGRTHLGGTRGPLASHILLREWSRRVSEPERLELLVHELGHWLGATHSPEPASVMRPVLGDRKAVARRFLIVFDPVNALAMNLMAEEIRDSHVERIYQVSARTRAVLVDIYLTLGKAFPEDPAAAQYLAMLGESPPATVRPARTRGTSLVDAARVVRDAVVDVADRNRRLPRSASSDGASARAAGDELTEQYVRAAAAAAQTLPEAHRYKAFALGLAITLADTDMFLTNSLTRELLPRLETTAERERRMSVIGAPTMRGRNDLARHFFFSTAIATLSSSAIAESAGLVKEMQDAQGASGFSFVDLAADLGGVALADYVRSSEERLRDVAQSFTIATFVPDVSNLREGLKLADVQQTYGSTSDPRFVGAVEQVRARVRDLPAYRKTTAAEAHAEPGDRR